MRDCLNSGVPKNDLRLTLKKLLSKFIFHKNLTGLELDLYTLNPYS